MELQSLPQADRRALQHIRNQVSLVSQWSKISALAECFSVLHQQLLDTDTEHPETANFKAEFLTLASDLVTG